MRSAYVRSLHPNECDHTRRGVILTGNTKQELTCKTLNMRHWEREVVIVFEEVEHGA